MSELYKPVLDEIGAVTARISDSEMNALCRLIDGARKVGSMPFPVTGRA